MNHSSKNREFTALDIAVLTVSDSRTEETDKSGALLVELEDSGLRAALEQREPMRGQLLDDETILRRVPEPPQRMTGWIISIARPPWHARIRKEHG